ncbi:CG13025 [Drosophila busckii]|uniref:RING-type E3 ubiquitin transferase n=1 Tax=Drosophila busckii TaxID=30019 RepID=A0A0M3QWY0_DROBS|nr:E3 ubiquitin-protein ligase RFWD3 [Drosophila busckii]ALC44909.1 CG13025 [Drosophila busckii]
MIDNEDGEDANADNIDEHSEESQPIIRRTRVVLQRLGPSQDGTPETDNPFGGREPVPEAVNALEPEEQSTSQNNNTQNEIITIDTPTPPKKRKRLSNVSKKAMGTPVVGETRSNDDDEDDGMTCPICLDTWEMSGDHRLVSLRCGHLFGENCIRRWLAESQRQTSIKSCPQCKTKVTTREIRYLYAKRVRAIDRSEEHNMRRDLEVERMRSKALSMELATEKLDHTLTANKLKAVQMDYDRLRLIVRAGRGAGELDNECGLKSISQLASHRLYMEKNIEITREPGCRVLLFSATHKTLLASQKSAQNLFPGYGVRFIDLPSFRPTQFVHTSAQLVRDIACSESQHTLTVASREVRIKSFDIRTRLSNVSFTAHDKQLWSCGVDREQREHYVYAGDLRGAVYVFDMRFPDNILSEYQAIENFSPVINIAAVRTSKTFPSGGLLVCQLTMVKFYDNENDTATPTRLNVEGPFLSVQYDALQDTVLISARSNAQYNKSRFILGQLVKIDDTPVLKITATIFGSTATPYMTRPTQMGVEDNSLVVGYLQDTKQLMMYDVRREERVQTMPINEVVYDICPVNTAAGSYLAALTDNKCRVYKVNSTKAN